MHKNTYRTKQLRKVKCLREPGSEHIEWVKKCRKKTNEIGLIIAIEQNREHTQQEIDRSRRVAQAQRMTNEFREQKEKEAIRKQLEEDEAILLQATQEHEKSISEEKSLNPKKRSRTNSSYVADDLENIALQTSL